MAAASAVRPRVRLVGTALGAGAAVGVVAFLAGTLAWGDPELASRKVFAVGTLLFGVGLLGWSGSVMAGRGIENLQHHLDTGANWTEADSRRAMARIGGFGAGWMLGAGLVAAVVVP